jgi:hypothetical protein
MYTKHIIKTQHLTHWQVILKNLHVCVQFSTQPWTQELFIYKYSKINNEPS